MSFHIQRQLRKNCLPHPAPFKRKNMKLKKDVLKCF